MNRRRFLAASLAAVAPLFLARAFAGDLPEPELAEVGAALQRAREAGRPLLVLVVPASDDDVYERAHAWGELLNSGPDEAMAQLGRVEVVCAHEAAIRAIAPRAAGRGVWAWLVPTDRMDGEPLAGIRPPVVQVETTPFPRGEDRDTWEAAANANIDARIDALAAMVADLVDTALGPISRLPEDERRAAAARAIATLRAVAPAGTHWATSTGCGTHVEGVETSVMIGCGMGSVPARSARFLYFWDIEKYRRGDLW